MNKRYAQYLCLFLQMSSYSTNAADHEHVGLASPAPVSHFSWHFSCLKYAAVLTHLIQGQGLDQWQPTCLLVIFMEDILMIHCLMPLLAITYVWKDIILPHLFKSFETDADEFTWYRNKRTGGPYPSNCQNKCLITSCNIHEHSHQRSTEEFCHDKYIFLLQNQKMELCFSRQPVDLGWMNWMNEFQNQTKYLEMVFDIQYSLILLHVYIC